MQFPTQVRLRNIRWQDIEFRRGTKWSDQLHLDAAEMDWLRIPRDDWLPVRHRVLFEPWHS